VGFVAVWTGMEKRESIGPSGVPGPPNSYLTGVPSGINIT